MKIYLSALYSSLLVLSICTGSKIIDVFNNFSISISVFTYAITFLIADFVTEIYGKQEAQKLVKSGLFNLMFTTFILFIYVNLEPSNKWANQDCYYHLFNISLRMFLGGSVAFVISQFVDINIFHHFKSIHKEEKLWFRNILSTLIGQSIDTVIFITISFSGVFPLMPLILGQLTVKIIILLIETPVLYAMVAAFKRASKNRKEDL